MSPFIANALRNFAAAALGVGLSCTASAATAAEPSKFAPPGLQPEAVRYEALLKTTIKPAKKSAREWTAEATKAMAGAAPDPRVATQNYSQAVVADPTDAGAWTGLSRALLAIKVEANSGSERYELPLHASAAAWIAYDRAKTAELKANALVALSVALQRRSQWRPAIDALRTSIALKENAEVLSAYDKLVAEKGFRITEYKADADAAQPRLCVQFSEKLATGQVDFSTFVTIDGKTPQSLNVEGRQLCIDGLAHGKRYEVQLRQGLPSAIANETLLKTVDLATYVRDRNPSVRTAGRAYVLPSTGQQGLPLITVNSEAVAIEIYRVGERGLAAMLQDGDFLKRMNATDVEALREKTGARVYQGELVVTNRLNEDVTTAFPVSDAIPSLKPGAYVLAATALPKKNDNNHHAIQWFIVSDLGLTTFTGDDGVHAFVRSLATATAVAGTTVKLIARNNEVLGTATTDAKGYARFDGGLKRGEGGLAPAVLTAETPSGDFSFLDLATAAFDLTDRGVKGREAPGPIDAYIFPDRGVYRPGESIYLTALVRDRAGKASPVPVTAIVSRPDGVEHRRVVLTDQGHGGRSSALALASAAMSGTWRVKIHTDPKADAIAETAFLVEDFVPEKIDLKLSAAAPALNVETGGTIDIAGRYLYGPAAAELAIEAEVVVKPSKRDAAGLAGYRFGLADEKITAVRKALEELGSTGTDGNAKIAVTLPPIDRTQRMLEADVIVKLRETSGRTIERTITLPVDLKQPRVGVKPMFANDTAGEGETVGFDAVFVGGDGKVLPAKNLKWELLRLDSHYQWFSRDNEWTYDVQTTTRRQASGSVDSEGAAPARIETRVDFGRYRLEVSASDGSGAATSIIFNAGYWADETADSPEMLDVALDKAGYKPGDVARVKVTSKMAGKALVAVLGSGLSSMQEVDIKAGGSEFTVPVADGWGAGAYVTVALYRPIDTGQKRMPGRALGLKWLAVEQEARTLNIALAAPAKVGSGAELKVPLRIAGLKAGEDARVVLTAVDVGILNLTRFEAPKPEGWFYGQRRLAFEIRDFYSRLIDGMRAVRGRLRSGGDGSGGGMSMSGSPPVEATLALYSGIVTVGADGTAMVPFQLPDFNGTVRVSAVAWSGDRVGSATQDVLVRDAVALTVAAPRFLTLGDEARLGLDVHNVEGMAAAYKVSVTRLAIEPLANGGKLIERFPISTKTLDLKAGEKKTDSLLLKPDDVGRLDLSVNVTGPDGIDVKRRLTLDVKPPAGDIKRVTVSQLQAKGGKLTVGIDLAHDMIPGRTRITLNVGPTAGLDVAGVMAELDRYPHGCAEQTTSRALPLVYLNDVARQVGMAGDTQIRERVQKAIERVLEMQDASGAFGIWGPSDGDIWLTSYVTDFLTRAREAKFTVPSRAFTQALDRLANFVAYTQDFEKGGEERSYALLVLARAGRAPAGELRYDVDTRLEKFATPLAQAQLGAALAQIGDQPRAEKAFSAAMKSLDTATADFNRRDYGSTLRDGAAIVTLAAESRMLPTRVPGLVDVVAKAYQAKRYTSTQEKAWVLLAAKALGDQAGNAALTVNGQAMKGQLLRSIGAADLKDGPMTIVNDGAGPINAFVSVVGAALTPEPPVANGFAIERSYYTLDGKKVELASSSGGKASVRQNDRFVVVVKVEAKETGGRIILVDRLPAGLEIENPRLVESGDIATLDWLKTTVKPEHAEFKDDRFVAAFDFFGSAGGHGRRGDDGEKKEAASTATVAYIVRAVTPGSFVHPAATVEDMYRPERNARTASGRLEVTVK